MKQHDLKKSDSRETGGTSATRLVQQRGKGAVEHGQVILDTINHGVGALTPDVLFKSLVKDYALAERIMGERLLRLVSGYAPSYIRNNVHIPEFQRELKKRIEQSVEQLRKEGLVGNEGEILNEGMELAALSLYMEELSDLVPHGITGRHLSRKASPYGERDEIVRFRGQRYRDLTVRESVRIALRRGHTALSLEDLRATTRESRGQCTVVYALDASGSMRGDKIAMCKKAGVALCYHALEQQDRVGLLVFGSEIKERLEPGSGFMELLSAITRIRAMNETDIEATVRESITMFPRSDETRHLMLITDALPTKGKEPEKRTLEAVSLARSSGMTISVIGVGLDEKGRGLARRMAELGGGRLYVARTLAELDLLVLEDYYLAAEGN